MIAFAAPRVRSRSRVAALAVLAAVLLGLCGILGTHLSAALDTEADISRTRNLLARTKAGLQPRMNIPLWATDEASLLAAFRARIATLTVGRAVLVNNVHLVPDPARPLAPILAASLRGTTQGLQGLLLDLETQPPFIVVETADLSLLKAADAEEDRPTILGASLTARGFLAPTKPALRNRTFVGTPPR
jgi:hypothetical protein